MVRDYTELRLLVSCPSPRGLTIGGRSLPLAAEALAQQGVEDPDPSPALDRQLLAAGQAQNVPGPWLCLRARISHALEERLRAYERQYGQAYGLDLIDLASHGLDDQGEPRTSADLAASPPLRPFTLEVLRDYDPSRCSLPHWARQKLHCNGDLKAYFRQHGLLLISDWALLADSSERRARVAWERCGAGAMDVNQALALHRAYRQHYPEAMAVHRQSSGRRSGWRPDPAFLRAVAPEQPTTTTAEQLWALATAIRRFLTAPTSSRGFADGEEAAVVDPSSLEAAAGEVADDQASAAELRQRIEQALERAAGPLVAATLKADQPRWTADPSRLLAWQLYGQGLSQRELAEQCGHQQAWVSKLLKEKQLAMAIATAAAAELKRHPAFAAVGRSVGGAERLVEALRNHLVTPEREGDVAPLRQAICRALPSLLP
ncbi:hypothetical protein [Vulcanococcus limneticus]|uniref:hypothetical protein n=1 Tax=Vulcanococcus limneticus TaxID=2170428 RepID=UPI00398C017C